MKSNLQSIYVFILVFLPFFAKAQQNDFHLNINYSPSLPLGSFKDVTDGMTWRGWELNLLYQASSKLSIGIGGSSVAFYKRYPQATFHESGSDITAVVTNSIEVMPIMVKAKYNLGTGALHPYVGLGAGINMIRYDKYFGQFVDYDHVVRFAAQPELGVHIPFTKSDKIGLNVGAAYNYMPYKNSEVDGLHNLSFKGGLDIRLD